MRVCSLLVVAVVVVFLGCHKKQEPAPAASQTSSAETPSTQGEKPPPPPSQNINAIADNSPRQNADGEVNANLTALLRRYVQKNGRMPRTFAEFASAALDSPPPPPDGKKWVIDANDQTVKAVNK